MYDAGLLKNSVLEVHHLNGNKKDNRIENLQIIDKVSHAKLSTLKGSKRPRHNSVKCKMCDTKTSSMYQLCKPHYKAQWYRKCL